MTLSTPARRRFPNGFTNPATRTESPAVLHNALVKAVKAGDINGVTAAIDAGARLVVGGGNALIDCVLAKQAAALEAILANPNLSRKGLPPDAFEMPMQFAANADNWLLVKIMLDYGVKPSPVLLERAITYDNAGFFDRILGDTKSRLAPQLHGHLLSRGGPFQEAAEYGRQDFLRRLLEHDASYGAFPAGELLVYCAFEGKIESLRMVMEFAQAQQRAGARGFTEFEVQVAIVAAHVTGCNEALVYLRDATGMKVDPLRFPAAPAGDRTREFCEGALSTLCLGESDVFGAGHFEVAIPRLIEVGIEITEHALSSVFGKGGENIRQKELPLEHCAVCRPPNGPPAAVLSAALRSGSPETVALLLNSGADFSKATRYSMQVASPAVKSVLQSHTRMQRLLIEKTKKPGAASSDNSVSPEPAPRAIAAGRLCRH